jgi:SprT protein
MSTAGPTLPREVPYTKRAQPDVNPALKERVMKSLMQWFGLAQNLFGITIDVPTISFDLTGTVAGYAYWRQNHIRLNHTLLAENIEKFESDILPHELCHLLVRNLYGKTPSSHGPEWKEVMRQLGVAPERLHSLNVANSRTTTKVFGYACRCNANNWLTNRQHKKAQSGLAYTCTSCKGLMCFPGGVT